MTQLRMLEPNHPLAELLATDRRYKFDAYVFVFEALHYAHKVLGMGGGDQPEPEQDPPEGSPREAERHLTGQQLCEAIRRYALEQYGYLAQDVLKTWGVKSTSDFGEIVFNLIRIGQMRKTSNDRREHFDDVFDFETGFRQSFKMSLPDS
jgi:uncharacterized repeat protein (TIGR04138 family)